MQTYSTLLPYFAGLLGLAIGSFLNVVIYRLPIMLHKKWQCECQEILSLPLQPNEEPFSLTFPASHCPACKHKLRWYHNIPLFSFLYQGGKCPFCLDKIRLRYPIVEMICALLGFYMAQRYGISLTTLANLIFILGLLCLALIDIDTHLLPDSLTLPMLWLGLLFNTKQLYTAPESAILGACLGYLSLWLVTLIFKHITQKDGMGQGDFKCLAMLGAWLGWQVLPFIILLASFLGCIVGFYLILVKHYSRYQPIPFGPFLCIAGICAWAWGSSILHFYLN